MTAAILQHDDSVRTLVENHVAPLVSLANEHTLVQRQAYIIEADNYLSGSNRCLSNDMHQRLGEIIVMAKSNEFAKGFFSVAACSTGLFLNTHLDFVYMLIRAGVSLNFTTHVHAKYAFDYVEHMNVVKTNEFTCPSKNTAHNPTLTHYHHMRRRLTKGKLSDFKCNFTLHVDFTTFVQSFSISRKNDLYLILGAEAAIEADNHRIIQCRINVIDMDKQFLYVKQSLADFKLKRTDGLAGLVLIVPILNMPDLILSLGNMSIEMAFCPEPGIDCVLLLVIDDGKGGRPLNTFKTKQFSYLFFRRMAYMATMLNFSDPDPQIHKKEQERRVHDLVEPYIDPWKHMWVDDFTEYGPMAESKSGWHSVDNDRNSRYRNFSLYDSSGREGGYEYLEFSADNIEA